MRSVEPRPPPLAQAAMVRAGATLGAVLSFAILATSALLRLNTDFDASGQAHSTLPAAVEDLARLVHRVAASGVGVLALLAVFLCVARRDRVGHAFVPIAWIVAATVTLAVIGPLTTGYKLVWVTVCNVAGGVVLLMAFCRVRAPRDRSGDAADALLTATLAVLVAHAATGAATSALGMSGGRGFAFIHAGTAMLATMFVGATLWQKREASEGLSPVDFLWVLLVVQVGLGIVAAVGVSKTWWMAFAHAVLSNLMAAGLASIAARPAGVPRAAARIV